MENFSDNNTQFNETSPEFDDSLEHNDSANSNQEFPNTFALFAKSLGIFSIFCAFFSMFFGTFICGGLAIILAILSKGYNKKMEKSARIGLMTGILSIVLQISVFTINVYNIIYVPEFREQFFIIYEEMYGEPLEESIDKILDEMGLPENKGGNL